MMKNKPPNSPSRKASAEEFHLDQFVNHTDCQNVMENLAFILELARTKKRPFNLIITGDAGSGKSTVLQAFYEKYKEESLASDDDLPATEVVLIDMPPEPTPNKLLGAINKAADFPSSNSANLGRFVVSADRAGLKLIMIDEFQHIDYVQRNHRYTVLNLLKWIGNQTGIAFAVAGTKSINLVPQNDQQFKRRFKSVHLRNWTDDSEFETFVISYLHALPIELPATIDNSLFSELLKFEGNRTHEIVETLSQASFEAYKEDDIENLHEYVRSVRERGGYVG